MLQTLLRFILALLLCAVVANGQQGSVADETTAHWAFLPLTQPAVPQTGEVSRSRTAVDSFLFAEIHKHELSFAPEADRATLIRRVYLDLIGLPPAPEEVDAFVRDDRPNAYDLLVERLLASPRFGERWARHWLDVVGYTDTVGFDIDANLIIIPDGKWKYRHYVIDAFNADKPYDMFIREQVAGDEMIDWRNAEKFTDEIRENLIATGFLRTASDFTHEPESDIPLNHFAVLHDTVEIVGNSLLGLTLQCSRCHDHKFDPVSQREYYQLMSFFTAAYNPSSWKPVYPWKPEIKHRGLPDISPRERLAAEKHNGEVDAQVASLSMRREELLKPVRDQLTAAKSAKDDQVSDEAVIAALAEDDRKREKAIQQQIASLNGTKRSWGMIQALYDVDAATHDTRILERGSYETPGEPVQPAFYRILSSRDAAEYFDPKFRSGGASGGIAWSPSGRRSALANWLTDSDAPASALVSRVIVNRVWQHLFGRGIVATPGNFGIQGKAPTHPELLDWLSSELVRQDWQLKPLIRLLVTSAVYRQASSTSDAPEADPENRLLWKMPLRRLDSEVVRDSILFAAGALDERMGGPPVLLTTHADGLVEVDQGKLRYPSEGSRRSVYLLTRRAYNESLLTAFDQPSIATTCSRRRPSAVVSQSLTMLNSKFIFEQANRVAERVAAAANDEPTRIRTAFRLILTREPTQEERLFCARYLQEQLQSFRNSKPDGDPSQAALTQLCQTLLNTSEFLYAE